MLTKSRPFYKEGLVKKENYCAYFASRKAQNHCILIWKYV